MILLRNLKLLILPAIACASSSVVLAQTEVLHTRFGIRAGASCNVMNFNAGANTGGAGFQNKWKPGFYLGAGLTVPLDETFSFQPEYVYRFMPGWEERVKAGYHLDYLSLPVLLKAAVSPRLAVLAGPEFGLLVRSTQKLNGTIYNVTHDTEERAISAVAGVEVQVAKGLVVDLRWVHGLNHVGLGQRSDTREFKWRGGEVGIGWSGW